MLDDLFLPQKPADKYMRAADQRGGAYSILTGIAANQRLPVIEPGNVGVDRGGPGPGFAFDAPSPTPARGIVALRFSLDRARPVRLSIHDVQGREVVVLIDAAREAGEQTVRWTGRDARGARVTPGVYLARLRAQETVKTRKIVFVP